MNTDLKAYEDRVKKQNATIFVAQTKLIKIVSAMPPGLAARALQATCTMIGVSVKRQSGN